MVSIATCSVVCVYSMLWGEANSQFNIIYELYSEAPFVYILKSDETYEIVDLTDDTLEQYIIPAEVNGKKVTSIADCSSWEDSIFYPARHNMKNVVFGANLKKIGAYSFYHCRELVDLEFNEGLEELGKNAFQDCTILESVTIPTTLKTFQSHVFRDCHALKTITYKAVNVEDMDDECRPFYMCGSEEHDLDVVFTDTVTHIPAGLFRSSST